jgi:transcriptional regulator with XRE-family HTH domain
MEDRAVTPQELLSIREELGMTQREFCAELKVTRHYVSLMECGKRRISPRMSVRIRELSKRLNSYPPNRARDEARRIFEDTMRLAGDNQERLSWMHNKVLKNLQAPKTWQR